MLYLPRNFPAAFICSKEEIIPLASRGEKKGKDLFYSGPILVYFFIRGKCLNTDGLTAWTMERNYADT